jgi:hypothetical protein
MSPSSESKTTVCWDVTLKYDRSLPMFRRSANVSVFRAKDHSLLGCDSEIW